MSIRSKRCHISKEKALLILAYWNRRLFAQHYIVLPIKMICTSYLPPPPPVLGLFDIYNPKVMSINRQGTVLNNPSTNLLGHILCSSSTIFQAGHIHMYICIVSGCTTVRTRACIQSSCTLHRRNLRMDSKSESIKMEDISFIPFMYWYCGIQFEFE